MYYPQDTTVEMGPTGVLPGSHYFNWLVGPIGLNMRLDTTEGEVPMAVEAGTVLMVHYDLWHRGMGNTHRQEALHDEVHVRPHRRAAGPELGL